MAKPPNMPINTGRNVYLGRAYGATSPNDSRAAYNDWANKYDSDLRNRSYRAPTLAVEALLRFSQIPVAHSEIRVLDAGCGTGLVGRLLVEAGIGGVDGVDYSSGMLEIARKTGAYRSLQTIDLTRSLSLSDDLYDVIICVGTLTFGHVGPGPSMGEFVRVTKPGGLIVATILDNVWKSDGFHTQVDELKAEGRIDVLSSDLSENISTARVQAVVLVMRVRG